MLAVLQHDASGGISKNRVEFWDLSAGANHPVPGTATLVCDRMAYSPDGRLLATGGASTGSNILVLRDATNGQPIKTFSDPHSWLGAIDFSPDGQTLAATSRGLTLWDTTARRKIGSLKDHMWTSLVFSPDGNRLAGLTLGRNGIELINDVKTQPRQVFLAKSHGTEMHVAFSPDGTKLAGSGKDVSAFLWDSSSGGLWPTSAARPAMGGRWPSPGGRSLIFASEDGRIRSWHFEPNPEPIARLAGHQTEVWALAFTPDGKTLLSAGDDHVIKLWNRHDGQLKRTLTGHGALVTALAVNRQGTVLASASFDQTVRLWELPGGKPGLILNGHSDRVRTVAFSPDGETLASAGSDNTIRLWNHATGKSVSVFKVHTEAVRALAFDPSGSWLVSTGDDQTINVMALGGRPEISFTGLSQSQFNPGIFTRRHNTGGRRRIRQYQRLGRRHLDQANFGESSQCHDLGSILRTRRSLAGRSLWRRQGPALGS